MDTSLQPAAPRRRRRRWILIGAVGVLLPVLLLAAVVVVAGTPQPPLPPLTLPTTGEAGPIEGTWTIGYGSAAGFRVRQTMLGLSNDVVGRTPVVTGTAVISGHQLASATFRIDLTKITVNDETQPKFDASLDTKNHPSATFTLTRPVAMSQDVDTGAVVATTATGDLTIGAVTRQVTFPLLGRRTPTGMSTIGSIPIGFSDFGIQPPKNYGPLGSLADHGTAEFRLVLRAS